MREGENVSGVSVVRRSSCLLGLDTNPLKEFNKSIQ